MIIHIYHEVGLAGIVYTVLMKEASVKLSAEGS